MAKLIKTQPENLLNLQNGDFAHFIEEGIVINDVKTVEPRHLQNNIHKTTNYRQLRIVLNILGSILILCAALYLGFYPLSLLLFLSLYDLRNLQHSNLPSNQSNFLPYNNIEEVKLEKGKLGLNYALIYLKDAQGKPSVKKLKLYDSKSGWERAVTLFKRIGKLSFSEHPVKDISSLEKITVGNGVEYAIDGDQLLVVENGKFNPEREDPFKYFRFVALIAFAGGITAIIAKVIMMMNEHHYSVIDFCVILLFVGLSYIPFTYLQKSRPTVLNKNKITSTQTKQNKFIIKYAGWNNFPLVIKHNLKYISEEDLIKLKNYIA